MADEQPEFKVKDRRLFNPDGTMRDVPPEETAARAQDAGAAGSAASSSATGSPAAASGSAGSAAPGSARLEREGPSILESGAGEPPRESPPSGEAREDLPGAEDPASFVNFLMSLASNAAASLGMMEHPATGQVGVDLELAKHWIDVLGMLQQKTRGNLVPQEQQIFEGLLSDLRMQYVSLTRRPKSAAKGFSGRDITGAR